MDIFVIYVEIQILPNIFIYKEHQCSPLPNSKDTTLARSMAILSMVSSFNLKELNYMISEIQSPNSLLLKHLNQLPNNSTTLLQLQKKLSRHGPEFPLWVLFLFYRFLARQRYMFDLAALIRRDTDKLAAIMT